MTKLIHFNTTHDGCPYTLVRTLKTFNCESSAIVSWVGVKEMGKKKNSQGIQLSKRAFVEDRTSVVVALIIEEKARGGEKVSVLSCGS